MATMTDDYGTRKFKIGAAALELGLSVKQLRKWITCGVIVAIRHPSGHYRITGAEILRVQVTTAPGPTGTHPKVPERGHPSGTP